MLEDLMRMYQAYMTFGTTGALPHLVGPPGSGKSTVIEELAELAGVELHIISVSRLSPLEVEGVQFPIGEGLDTALSMLTAAIWTRLKEGDILLMDEFLRGFPEVYNALLDIFTSRRVGSFRLPKVFIIGASNSVTTYDEALEDRLLHIPVPDPRTKQHERNRLKKILIAETGMHPDIEFTTDMTDLMEHVVMPTYNVLDTLKDGASRTSTKKDGDAKSVRNLVAQVQLRCIQSRKLKLLIEENNVFAEDQSKLQYLILTGKEKKPEQYLRGLQVLVGSPKLTPVQARNVELNIQLIELSLSRKERE